MLKFKVEWCVCLDKDEKEYVSVFVLFLKNIVVVVNEIGYFDMLISSDDVLYVVFIGDMIEMEV